MKAFLNFLDFGEIMSSKINIIKKEIEEENIINILEKLQFSDDTEIYDPATMMLQRYWSEEENFYQDVKDLMNVR